MSTVERPGVYIDYDASSVVSADSVKNAVAIAANLYSADSIKTFYSKSALAADELIANNTEILNMGNAAFSGGAGAVYILPAGGTDAEDYAAALSRIAGLTGVGAVVTDSTERAVHTALADYLTEAVGKQSEMLGFGYCTDADTALSAAAALNCERMTLICQGGAMNAAALAGNVVAAEVSDPLYDIYLKGASNIGAALTEERINSLIAGGVTPLETVGGKIYSVRTVSTRTQTDGASDRSYLDLQTIRIVDYVLGSVRTTLSAMVGGARNNAKSRLAIATQTEILLQELSDGGIIGEYDSAAVSASGDDPSVCIVSLGFTVARGISKIYIAATVSA